MGNVFHFKRFDVVDERSGLKVGTDGVLLGAAVNLPQDCPCAKNHDLRVLDIGTGTGVIALILAQRLAENTPVPRDFAIEAIEIDPDAAAEATANFAASPWGDSLHCTCMSLQKFGNGYEKTPSGAHLFDLIVSNPPYYDNSYLDGNNRCSSSSRAQARHTETLSYRDVVDFASRALSDSGHLALILPAEEEIRLLRCAASYDLSPRRILFVRTTASKAPKRLIVELGRKCRDGLKAVRKECLTIMDNGTFTNEYLALTGEFYLHLHK